MGKGIMVRDLSQNAFACFFKNYDYYWLKYTFERGTKENITSLLVGHSMPRFGVNDNDIPGLINLSFMSQDYYYSFKIIEKALKDMPSIKTVILGTSYMSPFMDLSKSKNSGEIARVVNVYGRYFHDIHNLHRDIYETNLADIVECSEDMEEYIFELYNQRKEDYFCRERNRQSLSDIIWSDPLSEDKRMDLVKKRTAFHNKFLAYTDAYSENLEILKNIAEICESGHAELIIVVFPSNSYYRRAIDPRFKESYQRQIEKIEKRYSVRCVDLYDSDRFDSIYDFVDTDHLNDRGAAAMTQFLRCYLRE